MDFYKDTVRFEVECKTCSTSFHYLQKLGGFVAPKCPECGEENNLRCVIKATTWEMCLKPGTIITTATVDGRE